MNEYKVKSVLEYAADFESAHVVEDYPYGRLRTQMKYWIEYRNGQGFRPVTCSLNPKTGKWNKPHKGTYTEGLAMYIEEGTNHTKFAHFSHYDRENAGEFYSQFESGLSLDGKKSVKFWEFISQATVAKKSETGKEFLDSADFLEVKAFAIRAMKEFFK